MICCCLMEIAYEEVIQEGLPDMNETVAGCCQREMLPGDVEANLQGLSSALPQFAERGCGLLLLPEMWSCGFAYPVLEKMAAKTPGVVAQLQEWARRYGMILVGSLPEADSGSVYNTSYVVDVTGEVVGKYRKIHLFSLHGEHLRFGRGDNPLVCETSAGRLGVMICYDLRFPELSRRLALDGAEILCVSALWPLPRIEHWSLLLRCRAIENQLFVMGCNGCGTEGDLLYGGSSAIVSPSGLLLAQGGNGESRITARLHPEDMAAFRKTIPCFSDRLPQGYGLR